MKRSMLVAAAFVFAVALVSAGSAQAGRKGRARGPCCASGDRALSGLNLSAEQQKRIKARFPGWGSYCPGDGQMGWERSGKRW
jgi:hypothetical protein